MAHGSGLRTLTPQAAATLRRTNGGAIPKCRVCKRVLRTGQPYYSRALRHRAYYHVPCWERVAEAEPAHDANAPSSPDGE